MEEIDELLADEIFCRSLLDGAASESAAAVLTNLKVEQNDSLWFADGDSKNGSMGDLWPHSDYEGPLVVEGGLINTFDAVLMQSSARQSPSESGRSSLTESASAYSTGSGVNALQYSNEPANTYSSVMSEFQLQDSSTVSSAASSSNSNIDPLDDQHEMPYDEEFDVDCDLDDNEDCDDETLPSSKHKNSNGKSGGQTQPVTKKPPLFQPLRSTGELRLTELEKQTLAQEGFTIQTRLPLSKHDERILKQFRRKIRNKISAQESRRKKRAHVDDLELRLKHFARENRSLRAQLKAKEDAFQKVASRFSSLRAFVSRHIRFDIPSSEAVSAGTGDQITEVGRSKQVVYGLHPKPAFMALFLCFAVLVGCRPGALRTSGFFFSSSVNSPADVLRFAPNLTDSTCEIALIAYPCDANGRQGSEEFLEEYYFDGRSFFDRNAPSIRSLRTLKRFSDQSNVFRDAASSSEGTSTLHSAFDSLLNALRYSTARTLFRRTVSATSAKLAAKLNSDKSSDQIADSINDMTDASASSANAVNGKLLDQRAAPGRTLLFKWSMNDTALSDWWNKVMRSFVGEPFCLSYMY